MGKDAVARRNEIGLAGWPNDDLALTDRAKSHLREFYPSLAPIFIAEDLADLFRQKDAAASAAKRRARRGGYWAVSFGFASLVLASLTPLLVRWAGGGATGENIARALGATVALLAILSFSVGLLTILRGNSKHNWLLDRIWTERIRQFHFQIIVNNLPSASRAASTGDYSDWKTLRQRAFHRFRDSYMKNPEERLIALLRDTGEQKVWIDGLWQKAPEDLDSFAMSDELRTVYREQRFGIQEQYTRLALFGGSFGAESRAKAIWGTAWFFTLVAVGMSVALAVLYAVGGTPNTIFVQVALAGLGVSGAFVVAARALEDGLQASAEKERLEWYLAATSALKDLYDQAKSETERVEVMRDMERLSYLEMRRFFIVADRTRFIM